MLVHLLIVIVGQVCGSAQTDLRADIINRLSEMNEWKTLALVLDESDPMQRWVTEILVSRVIIDLTDRHRPELKGIDAYIILSNDLAVLHGLEYGVATGKVDSLKTFVLIQNHYREIVSWEKSNKLTQLDWILVWRIWKVPGLMFQRHRRTSALAQLLDGRFDAINGMDATAVKILRDRSFSYHDEVVKVSAFLHPPTTSACESGEGLCGRDINMIKLIGQLLHFRPEFVNPPNNTKWGSFVNGSWTGLVGEVQKGSTEMGVANLYLAGPYLLHIEFSYPYGLSCSSFMVLYFQY